MDEKLWLDTSAASGTCVDFTNDWKPACSEDPLPWGLLNALVAVSYTYRSTAPANNPTAFSLKHL